MGRYLIPLALFALLVVLLGVGLNLDPRKVPSPLIDKPAPAFALPDLHNGERLITPDAFQGQVWILNVWASWCVSCRAEHEQLLKLASMIKVNMVGLNYKDTNAAALGWLKRYGDPYSISVVDADGKAGIDWGVYGVPETFVMDKRGTVRYKHIGPVGPADVGAIFLPLIQQLEGEPA